MMSETLTSVNRTF